MLKNSQNNVIIGEVEGVKSEIKFDINALEFQVNNGKTIILPSKSSMFRKMYELGVEISDIARACNSHYSFVHGVIDRGCKKRKVQKSNKSLQIRKMLKEGQKARAIARELDTPESYVYTIKKKMQNEEI